MALSAEQQAIWVVQPGIGENSAQPVKLVGLHFHYAVLVLTAQYLGPGTADCVMGTACFQLVAWKQQQTTEGYDKRFQTTRFCYLVSCCENNARIVSSITRMWQPSSLAG